MNSMIMGLRVKVGAYDEEKFRTFKMRSQTGIINAVYQAAMVAAVPNELYFESSI